MELPKNITQIGEADKHCKIYVEDYVVSYISQMNGIAQNKDIAIALYGRKTVEDGVTYLFAYGSAKLNFLQKAVRHLSQAQEQEIEKLRKKYFSEMTFLGYRILNGEMVEGFHVCEQEICRYVEGYAQFYEKNDSMLAYMLENREEEAAPEKVDLEKYETVRKRQEERKLQQYERQSQSVNRLPYEATQPRKSRNEEMREKDNVIQMPTVGLRRMKMAATGVFALLCVIALALMRQENTGESLGEAARQAMSSMMEQKLADAVQEAEPNANSTLVAEDKLEEALRQENKEASETSATEENTDGEKPVAESANEMTEQSDGNLAEDGTEMTQDTTQDVTEGETTDVTPTASGIGADNTGAEEAFKEQETAVQPTAYTIQKGDTLIGISLRNYGSNSKVSEICKLNGIKDPDDIKIGQEIFLP